MTEAITPEDVGLVDGFALIILCCNKSATSYPAAEKQIKHTQLLIRVGVRRLHRIFNRGVVGLDRDLVSQFRSRLASIRIIDNTSRDGRGVVLALIVVLGFSFDWVGHFRRLQKICAVLRSIEERIVCDCVKTAG